MLYVCRRGETASVGGSESHGPRNQNNLNFTSEDNKLFGVRLAFKCNLYQPADHAPRDPARLVAKQSEDPRTWSDAVGANPDSGSFLKSVADLF
jgi:hypothetical protein